MSMEENKYKYLVNVSNLARLVKYSINTGCCPDDSTHYIVTVSSKDRDVWETFHKMRMREDDDILFCISTQVARALILVYVDHNFDNIHHTFDLNFIGTEYSLDSEFAKGLKRINSLDDIEKSHSDEPGEQGTTSGIPLFSDVVDVWDYDISVRKHTAIVRARKTSKTMDSIKAWFSTKPPRLYYYILEEGSQDFYFLNNVEVQQDLAIFEFSYYGNVMSSNGVSFSLPTLIGPRDTKPLQPGMLTYTDTADASSKDETVCTKQKSLSEILLETYPAVKSTLEREMNLIQRCKIHSDLFEREEAPKFPQMRRARLNKPKSI